LRNVSGGSVRTAIRLPKTREKESVTNAHKMRKDSIGMPQTLGSPFVFERSRFVNETGRGEGNAYGVGEAI
jgi:hypothetical protein